MALYSYQAFSKDGKKINGHVDAPSLQGVKEQLTRQGLFPISIEIAKDQTGAKLVEEHIHQKSYGKRKNIIYQTISNITQIWRAIIASTRITCRSI